MGDFSAQYLNFPNDGKDCISSSRVFVPCKYCDEGNILSFSLLCTTPRNSIGSCTGKLHCPGWIQHVAFVKYCPNGPNVDLCSSATVPNTICRTGPCIDSSSRIYDISCGVGARGLCIQSPPPASGESYIELRKHIMRCLHAICLINSMINRSYNMY